MFALQRKSILSIFMTLVLLLLTSCEVASEDDNLRIVLSQRSYSLTEKITITMTARREGFFHGPCQWWFEEKTGETWEKTGECPKSNFADEPFPRAAGDERTLSLPTWSTGSDINYNYQLTPGTYRFAQIYNVSGTASRSVSYSPEFDITANGR